MTRGHVPLAYTRLPPRVHRASEYGGTRSPRNYVGRVISEQHSLISAGLFHTLMISDEIGIRLYVLQAPIHDCRPDMLQRVKLPANQTVLTSSLSMLIAT